MQVDISLRYVFIVLPLDTALVLPHNRTTYPTKLE
jgi:hypothetical protein